jgi:hypothetical protein
MVSTPASVAVICAAQCLSCLYAVNCRVETVAPTCFTEIRDVGPIYPKIDLEPDLSCWPMIYVNVSPPLHPILSRLYPIHTIDTIFIQDFF